MISFPSAKAASVTVLLAPLMILPVGSRGLAAIVTYRPWPVYRSGHPFGHDGCFFLRRVVGRLDAFENEHEFSIKSVLVFNYFINDAQASPVRTGKIKKFFEGELAGMILNYATHRSSRLSMMPMYLRGSIVHVGATTSSSCSLHR